LGGHDPGWYRLNHGDLSVFAQSTGGVECRHKWLGRGGGRKNDAAQLGG
jgi:hypothetical protein